ncbi:MAG: hypothetical protein ACXWQO_15445 [Bdellovibrionota bacterium]
MSAKLPYFLGLILLATLFVGTTPASAESKVGAVCNRYVNPSACLAKLKDMTFDDGAFTVCDRYNEPASCLVTLANMTFDPEVIELSKRYSDPADAIKSLGNLAFDPKAFAVCNRYSNPAGCLGRVGNLSFDDDAISTCNRYSDPAGCLVNAGKPLANFAALEKRSYLITECAGYFAFTKELNGMYATATEVTRSKLDSLMQRTNTRFMSCSQRSELESSESSGTSSAAI